jgi:hypothetical protein
MTVLEGQVAQEQWAALTAGFAEIGMGSQQQPAELTATYLVQGVADPTIWRTIGVWSSQQAFDAYRAIVPVPPPLALFRSLGVTPALAFFEVKG